MSNLRALILSVLVPGLLELSASSCHAQRRQEDPYAPRLGEAFTQQYKAGIIVSAGSAPCVGIVGVAPVPIDWDEQHVRIVNEDISASVREIQYRDLEGGVRQMVISVPYLAPGEEARAVVTFEVTRHTLLPPGETSTLVIPRKIDRATRVYLGPSPGIETRQAQIKKVTKDILAQHEEDDAWHQVEALYDWVRANVTYKAETFKGAAAALKSKVGDCEDMSSLFIALCRVSGVPARTVWVPGHCYPEFYLEDPAGKGHWFPCQAAGTRAFGEIPDKKPILQKGDNFKVPERSDRQRYAAEYLTARGGKPSVKWVREDAGAGG